MSQENVEIVRLILTEWERGNFGAPAKVFSPEVRFETWMPDAAENAVARGLAELEHFTRDWLAQWQGYRIVGDEFQAVGPDKVFVAVRQLAQGRQSGVEVESPGFSVWTLRDGEVVKLSLHYDRDSAVKAAGLSE